MRRLRPLLLALLVLALAASTASAQTQAPTIKLPGGGEIKVKLPKPPKAGKGKGKKTPKFRAGSVSVGIADQKATMFADPRFRSLRLRTARRSVAWDFYRYDWQIADIEDWLKKARAARVRPLITFARSRVASRIHLIPTRAQWRKGFKEFRKRYPWVKEFIASNESNHTPPTAKKPELAARYYLDMRKACRTCTIGAATINELQWTKRKITRRWVKRFIKTAKHQPKVWALHNYYGANTFKTRGTSWFLKQVKGQVWITEVGGVVKRRSGNFAGKLFMREGLSHSTRAWKFIFDRMLPLSRRIRRAYLYHWDSSGPLDTWDSALVGYDGKARGGLAVIKQKLKRR